MTFREGGNATGPIAKHMAVPEAGRIADRYRTFGMSESAGESPLYATITAAIAEDWEILQFLSGLPVAKQQPNLLLASVAYLHGTAADYRQSRAWLTDDLPRGRRRWAGRGRPRTP